MVAYDHSINEFSKLFSQQIIDEPSATVTYIGFAQTGDATNAKRWVILKIETVANVTTFKWATGYRKEKRVWDDRLTYTYVS